MNILIACEFSGVVRDAFIKKGHNAISCDLLKSDTPGPHIKGNILEEINKEWDMIIAHPPCTYLCAASNGNIHKPHLNVLENRKTAFNFFMEFVNCVCKKVAIENPIGYVNSHYRKPDQIIQPWMFGHGYRKDVCLWLKNLPKIKPTKIIKGPYKRFNPHSSKRNPNGRSLKSITYTGIAQAMANQWT